MTSYELNKVIGNHKSPSNIATTFKVLIKRCKNYFKNNIRSIRNRTTKDWIVCIEERLPVIRLLRDYRISQYLPGDILAGLSVGLTTVPQSLGLAILAGVPPIVGLYTSVFPVFIYFLFTTSRHVSTGTMALGSLIISTSVMKGKIGTTEMVGGNDLVNSGINLDTTWINNSSLREDQYNNGSMIIKSTSQDQDILIAASVSCVAGLFLIAAFILRLGTFTVWLSDAFINGYLAASTVRVLTHQAALMAGIHHGHQATNSTRLFGDGNYFLKVVELTSSLHRVNLMQVFMSVASLTFLISVQVCVNERYKHRLLLPIPADLITVILATVLSSVCNLEHHFDVQIIKSIPTGFPTITLPCIEYMQTYIMDGINLGIVSYIFLVMMARMFAETHQYNIDTNQELLATGFSCAGGSFFTCLASSASPSRSFLMEAAGGKTQVAYLISAFVSLACLLLFADLLESLPVCILASHVIATNVRMFHSFRCVVPYWRSSDYYDLSVWFVTMMSTLCIGIDMGMIIGVIFSLVSVNVRLLLANSSILLPATIRENHLECITDHKDPNILQDLMKSVVVFRYESPIIFSNITTFKRDLFTKVFRPGTNCTEKGICAKQMNYTNDKIKQEVMKKDVNKSLSKCCFACSKVSTYTMRSKNEQRECDISECTVSHNVYSASKLTISEGEIANGAPNNFISNSEIELPHIQEKTDMPFSCNTEGIKQIVLDMCSVSFIDTSAAMLLINLHEEYHSKNDVRFVLANCTKSVHNTLGQISAANGNGTFVDRHIYPTLYDAIKLGSFTS